MPPKFAQNRPDRDRDRRNDGQIQPSVLAAAELHYRLSPAFPHYPQYQTYPKASSSTITPSVSASNHSRTPYHQRLVAAALATPAGAGAAAAAASQAQQDDQQSSNDSSSAPSSNAVSSSVLSAGTSSTAATSASSSSISPSTTATSKSKEKITSTSPVAPAAAAVHAPVPSIARPAPTPLPVPAQIAEPPLLDPDSSYFERLMVDNAYTLPEPGPSYFEHQRMLWKTAPPNPPRPASPGHSRIKLESLLSQPGAVESEEVWRAGLKNVWKGLVGGNQLKKRLPLHIVLKILQAGWLRDGTWPEGMAAPPWESGQQQQPPSQMSMQQHQQQYQKPSQGDSSSQMAIDNPHHQQGGSSGSMAASSQYQRRTHEQEAYAAALHARASEEQASGTAQMMHMQAYAMMGLAGGIPPGYSPSSGENPEDGGDGGGGMGGGEGGGGYYVMPYPYPYAETTPPLGDREPGERRRSQEYFGRGGGGGQGQGQGQGQRRSPTTAEMPGPPPSPALHPEQDIMDSEMDTEDEQEAAAYAEEEAWRDEPGRRMEGVVQTGDGRHEGG